MESKNEMHPSTFLRSQNTVKGLISVGKNVLKLEILHILWEYPKTKEYLENMWKHIETIKKVKVDLYIALFLLGVIPKNIQIKSMKMIRMLTIAKNKTKRILQCWLKMNFPNVE